MIKELQSSFKNKSLLATIALLGFCAPAFAEPAVVLQSSDFVGYFILVNFNGISCSNCIFLFRA